METTTNDEARGYGTGMTVLAVVLTLISPLIALVVALVLMSGQQEPAKRGFLRLWAWISGALVAVGVIVVLIAIIV